MKCSQLDAFKEPLCQTGYCHCSERYYVALAARNPDRASEDALRRAVPGSAGIAGKSI
jgi:hypothetical protein